MTTKGLAIWKIDAELTCLQCGQKFECGSLEIHKGLETAWTLRRFGLNKVVPLAISRGTTALVEVIEVALNRDGIIGRGETGGLETGHRGYPTDEVAAEIDALMTALEGINPFNHQAIDPISQSLSPPARCGIDLALLDWSARCLKIPLWRLWGLNASISKATSITVGLAVARMFSTDWRSGGRCSLQHE